MAEVGRKAVPDEIVERPWCPPCTSAKTAAPSLFTALRNVTARLPHRRLTARALPIAGLLSAGFDGPGRWSRRRRIGRLAESPMDTLRDKLVRGLELDTFDRPSALVEPRYVWADLRRRFDDPGPVVDAAPDGTGWFILAPRA